MSDCVNCRSSVPADAKFCPACGCRVERAALEAAPQEPTPAAPAALLSDLDVAPRQQPEVPVGAGSGSSRMLQIFAAAAVIVLAVALFITFGGGDRGPQGRDRPAATLVEKSPQIPPAPPVAAPVDEAITARPVAPPPTVATPRYTVDKPPPVEAPSRAVMVEKQDAQERVPSRPAPSAVVTKQREQLPSAAGPQVAVPEQSRGDRKLARQLNARGLALSREGRHAEAAAQFRAARDADSGDPEIRENLGYSLLKDGQLAEAESALRAAIEIAPRRATALGSLGFVEAKRGRHQEGVKLMLAALRVAPDPQQTLATYSRQARTESDPKVRAMLAEVVSRAP